MKLPEPPFLSLFEACQWCTDRGIPEEKAKGRLRQAFRYGEIVAWGRPVGFEDELRRIKTLAWEKALIDWEKSRISIRDQSLGDLGSKGVLIQREDFLNWLSPSSGSATNARDTESPEYRSPYMDLMLAAEKHFGMRLTPSPERALIKEVQHWLRENWREFINADISENRIIQMASLIRHPELGKGGNKSTR